MDNLRAQNSGGEKKSLWGLQSLSFLIPSPGALAGCSGSSLVHSPHMGPGFLETLSIHMRLWLLPNLPLSHNVLSQSTRTDILHRVSAAYTTRRDPRSFHLQPTQKTSVDTLRRDSLPLYLQTSLLRLAQLCKPKGSPKILLFKLKTNLTLKNNYLSHPQTQT